MVGMGWKGFLFCMYVHTLTYIHTSFLPEPEPWNFFLFTPLWRKEVPNQPVREKHASYLLVSDELSLLQFVKGFWVWDGMGREEEEAPSALSYTSYEDH